MRSGADFRNRYEAYARNHAMTSEQMRIHDKQSHPEAMLTPYLFWLSLKRLEWNRLHPDIHIPFGREPIEFDRWLQRSEPTSSPLTCECHAGTTRWSAHH